MAEFTPTEGQRLAIEDTGGEILVSAAAGSGKTRVLTERLLRLVEAGADIDAFLVITFTKAAAAELRGRIAAALGERAQQSALSKRLRRQAALVQSAQIGTIHGFCASILREYAHEAGIAPDFSIADEDRAGELRAIALERVLEDNYERAEPLFLSLADTVGAGRDDRRLSELVLRLYDKLQSHARPGDWAREQSEMLENLPQDALDTPCGAELMRSAQDTALYWAGEMDALIQRCAGDERLEKAYKESLAATSAGLHRFAAEGGAGWDEARACLPVPFPRVGHFKGSAEDEEARFIKARRESCKKAVGKLSTLFAEDSAKLLGDLARTAGPMRALLALLMEFDARYSAEKRRRSLLDYADLEHMAARLLTDAEGNPTRAAREISRRYDGVMVDEYQDVSRVQDLIIRAVSRSGRNLFMVGDVKQSIYRFRLADPTIFLEKYLSYADAPAPEGVPRRIFLSDNFRSRREIVGAVNAVFGCIMSGRLGELDYDERAVLRAAGRFEGSVPLPEIRAVAVPEADEEGERPAKTECEAAEAAKTIRSLIEGGAEVTENGVRRAARYGDVAILLRSANVSGAAYRRALERAGVPVQSGAAEGFFSSPDVKTMLSVLSVIDNPRRDVPLIAVLSSPFFGFTPDDLAAVRMHGEEGDGFYDCLLKAAQDDPRCRAFLDGLDAMRSFARDAELPELFREVYSRLDVFALCSAMPDGAERRSQLVRLYELAKRFEATLWRGLHRFLGWLRLMEERGEEPMPSSMAESGAVTVMSIHRSKGLEFPIVLLCDTARRFNRQDSSIAVLMHPELGLGPKLTDTARGIEYPTIARRAIARRIERETLSEEMRLLYVAMTRAKERLIITCALRDPEKELEKLAPAVSNPMAAEVLAGMSSPAQWLISAALADGGKHIALTTVFPGGEAREVLPQPEQAPGDAEASAGEAEAEYEKLRAALGWEYPFRRAEALPSKVTATELKSLYIPDEEAQPLPPRAKRLFRRPEIGASGKKPDAAERGTATHLALRYIDLAAAAESGGAARELERLISEGRLSPEEAAAVDAGAVERLARSETGRLIINAPEALREFPFSVLCPAGELFPDAPEGEEILLQGVTDCCVVEPDGITIIDYKTDRADAGMARERAAEYLPQLDAYAYALSRVTEKPVKRRVVYFLHCSAAVEL